MYLINKAENNLSKLEEKTFSELGFKERDHLQEWLANNPEALGEELLIIQKEFDGFNDTYERLDLLAIDKQGDLVIIENKLDNSGRDVTWQVLKYASYCSNLSKEEIRQIYQQYLDKQQIDKKAEDMISAFFEDNEYEEISLNSGNTQRIIMVAGKFRKEVTSTVLWLMNFKLRIQCFKVTPFSFGEELILNIEQILPVQDTEELTIGMANKMQNEVDVKKKKSEVNKKRYAFWTGFLKVAKEKLSDLKDTTPSEYARRNIIPSSIARVNFIVLVAKNSVSVQLYIDRGKDSFNENREIFNALVEKREVIESNLKDELIWSDAAEYRACRITLRIDIGGYDDEALWDMVYEETLKKLMNMESVFKPHLKKTKI